MSAHPALESLRGAHVLVTGGSGFLGGWALAALAAADEDLGLGLKLTTLTRDPARFVARTPQVAARVAVIYGDVVSPPDPPEPPTHVIHAAAPPHRGTSDDELDRVIVGGTAALLAAAVRWGTKRFLYVSSGAVYGTSRPQPRTELEPLVEPLTPYGRAKVAAEALCSAARGLETVRARGFAFLGPGLPLDGSFAAGDLLLDASRGGPLRLRSTGASVRTYLDAEEAGTWLAVMLAAGDPGVAYNLGGGVPLTVAMLAGLIAETAGLEANSVELGADKAADSYVPDLSFVRERLGLTPRVGLTLSVAAALRWIRDGAPGARG